MANKAISELPQALNVNNQDLFVLEQSGIAKKLPAETFITEQGIIDALAEALDGHGGIQSVTLSSVSGRIRTYLITFTDQSATTFQVYDGTSIDRISRTSSSGLDDVYTIFLSDGTTTFFTVHNGADGTVSEAMLNDALKDKAPAVTETTESSAIANFPDGADDMPIQSLVAEIEPIQDLTYGDPYPAGSKNQLIFKTISGNIESNGKIVSTSDFHLLVAKVTAAQTYISSTDGVATSSGALVLAFFSSEPEIGSVSYDGQRITTGQNPFVAPIDGYVAIRVASSSDVRRQIEAGSTATAYFPYSNICPITGWTGCMVYDNNGNWFIKADGLKGLWCGNLGDTVLESQNALSAVVPCKPNTGYIITKAQSSRFRISYVKKYPEPNDPAFGTVRDDGATSLTYTTGAEAKYLVIYCWYKPTDGDDPSAVINSLQVELGQTATEYKTGIGTSISLSWQTEAGTVYGGTIDVATGLLTVTHGFVTISDFGNPSSGTSAGGLHWADTSTSFGATTSGNSWCSMLTRKDGNSGWGSTSPCYSINTTGSVRIYITETTKAAMESAYADLEIAYPLATPQTYQLTPQEVKTLLGTNNVWADTGNVSVTYPADTKMFIEKLTMPTEDDLVANQAITSGKYFMIGNSLYLALANIASGAQITIGTNAQRVSLADALNTINS